MLRVIPVIDLKAGQVVRGVAGRRHHYKPVISQLTPSSDPVEVARAFHEKLGLHEIYVADLDALEGAKPAWNVYDALSAIGLRLWVDAGIRDRFRAYALRDSGVEFVIAALETLDSFQTLEHVFNHVGAARTVFSLDMNQDKVLGSWPSGESPCGAEWTILNAVLGLGMQHLIVLDLSRIGMGLGPGTESLCRRIRDSHPDVQLITGGGVQTVADLRELQRHGVSGALVASALHDGRLQRRDFMH